MGYQKTENGAETVFDVTPEIPPDKPGIMKMGENVQKGCAWMLIGYTQGRFFWVFIAGSLLFSLVSFVQGNVLFALFGIAWAAVIWYLKKKEPKNSSDEKNNSLATKNRNSSKFTVSSQGISLNGQFFKTTDIHRITIKNLVHDMQEGQVIFSASHTGSIASKAGADARNAGIQIALAYQKKLAEVSYHVQFESGGVPHVLAGGLTEAGAFAIQTDVARILGFK